MAISYGTPLYRDGETRVCYDALTLAIAKADGWTDTPAVAPAPDPTPPRVTRPKKAKKGR